jgi:CheY-like chemotaxis protein
MPALALGRDPAKITGTAGTLSIVILPSDHGIPLPSNDLPSAPVVALSADLLFAARIRGAAQAVGADVELARTGAALLARARTTPPRRILLDLDTRSTDPIALIEALKADAATSGIEVVAYVSHVREDLIERARAAGADHVLARGAFTRQLASWVR